MEDYHGQGSRRPAGRAGTRAAKRKKGTRKERGGGGGPVSEEEGVSYRREKLFV
jgi:hypothetical protein